MQILTTLRSRGILLGLVFVLSIISFQDASAQRVALKTNALEYLILSPNLTLEARLSRKITAQLGVSCNPMQTDIKGYRLANYRVEPEVRYWFNRPMAKHFIALSATAGSYSIEWNYRYYKGDAVAAGISYGYALVLSRHWNVEFELGVGLVSMSGIEYTDPLRVPEKRNFSKKMPAPIRAAVSFGYIFK
ncbi:MAG: DUF3575 domain-containing protein [Bacteroidales bacterium]|nr:DUF3575 domain-containing protein [Bacteroidales bacterium]